MRNTNNVNKEYNKPITTNKIIYNEYQYLIIK